MLYIKQLTLKHTVNKVLQKQVLNIQTLFKPTNDIALTGKQYVYLELCITELQTQLD